MSDNRLLIYLLGRLPEPGYGPLHQGDWNEWLDAAEDGLIRPVPGPDESTASPVWRDESGLWVTSFPAPEGFSGQQWGEQGEEDYCRELSDAELESVEAWARRADNAEERRRDCYFGRLKGIFAPPLGELSEPSSTEPVSHPFLESRER